MHKHLKANLLPKIYVGLFITIVFMMFSVIFLNFSDKASATDNSFYIDCSAGTNGSGTIGSPWNTPQSLFNHQRNPTRYTFGGGDRVLIKAGTTCNYPIQLIRGSGVPGNPVVVTSYDSGPRPIINGSNVEVDNWDGPGKGDSATVQLRDFDNVTVEGLELTNTGGANLESRRMGVWSLATEVYGARRNITIRDNYIHDIWGEYKKNTESTAGINIEQRLPPTGVDPTPGVTWYENILIEDNVIENINRQGITMWGDWRNRAEDGYNPTGPAWTAWTNVVVQDNTVNHVRGDAIFVSNTDGAILQRNTVNGFNELNGLTEPEVLAIRQDAQTKQGLGTLPSRNHAGIWTYNADNTLIQYNDTRGGVSNHDGMAYDIDGGSIGTIIQYNYSQDNEGGFVLICGEIGQIRDGKVRYNISKDDGYATITTCVGEVLTTEVYNNTIYSTDSSLVYPYYQVDWERFGGDPMNEIRDISLENNIFYYFSKSIPNFFYNVRDDSGLTPGQVDPNVTASTNLFSGVAVPTQDSEAITDTPLFVNAALEAEGFEQFESSAGVGIGKAIINNGGVDYFGDTLSSPYNLGAIHSTSEDVDPIPDEEEDEVNEDGDGNGDGIQDSTQSNVSSFLSPTSNSYITLQIMDVGQTSGAPTKCTTIDKLESTSQDKVATDAGYIYPVGMIDFTISCSNPGDNSQVTILLDKLYETDNWDIRKMTTSFSSIEDAVISSKTVGDQTVTTISYVLTDGGDLDADSAANSSIDDPVGPATLIGAADTGIPSLVRNNPILTMVISGATLLAYRFRSKFSKN